MVGALTAPTSMALPCRWRSRPQHQMRTLGDRTAWLTMQSIANQSPQPNSLLTGKLTWNVAEIRPSTAISVSSQRVNSMASSQIPYATEQGNLSRHNREKFRDTGN